MKFRKGQKVLKVPAMGALLWAYLENPGGTPRQLEVVHIDNLVRMRKQYGSEQAWPMQCALAMGAHEVHLWPTPHRAGAIKMMYYPMPEEI